MYVCVRLFFAHFGQCADRLTAFLRRELCVQQRARLRTTETFLIGRKIDSADSKIPIGCNRTAKTKIWPFEPQLIPIFDAGGNGPSSSLDQAGARTFKNKMSRLKAGCMNNNNTRQDTIAELCDRPICFQTRRAESTHSGQHDARRQVRAVRWRG